MLFPPWLSDSASRAMSGLHSTGHARRGFQVRMDHVGRTNNGESYEKSVANGQAAKKPAPPMALKSSHAMPF